MFGVFKRKLKTKRPIANDSHAIAESVSNSKSSTTQKIHPVFDDKSIIQTFSHDFDKDIEFYPTKLKSVTLPAVLTPNICVEDGRIEFVKKTPKTNSDSEQIYHECMFVERNVRDSSPDHDTSSKLTEDLKIKISALEAELKNVKKVSDDDKQLIDKLQQNITKRDASLRDEERKLKESTSETIRCKARLRLLTYENHRMEDAVRSMVVHKGRLEQLKQEKSSLITSYETRIQYYQSTISSLNNEILSLKAKLDDATSSIPKSASTLNISVDDNRNVGQYEQCLDDIANQVVKAVLTQKNLQQEISTLKVKIKELENQNCILTTLLFQFIYESSKPNNNEMNENTISRDNSNLSSNKTVSTLSVTQSPSPESINGKTDAQPHFNSFNSESLSVSENKTLSEVCNDDIQDCKLSLDDKKRHQILTDLWKDLKNSEVTPQKLIEALSKVDSSLWVPPKRPVTLNLKLPVKSLLKSSNCCNQFISANQHLATKNEEETGNESPESGNRDEGYSTMSSDVQCETTRPCSEPSQNNHNNTNSNSNHINKCLEDLKEAVDETTETNIENRKLILEDVNDPDIFYIPLNLTLGLNSRNSYPPRKTQLPFHYAMRSFSDSHLCLKLNATPNLNSNPTSPPSPIYSILSPIASSPSVLLLDLCENKSADVLKRTQTAETLIAPPKYHSTNEISKDNFVHHWLLIDETRTKLLEQHRYLFDVVVDQSELEDWSLSLSCDDVRDCWKKSELITPGQMSTSTLPSIQENNALELEEDSSEFLWNDSSYMSEFKDAVQDKHRWPYVSNKKSVEVKQDNVVDGVVNNEHLENINKKFLTGAENDADNSCIGTDFTRDFYRLVKFESTKSLECMSSRSLAVVAPTVVASRNDAVINNKENVKNYATEQQNHNQKNEISPDSSSKLSSENVESVTKLSSIPVLNSGEKFKRRTAITNDNKPIINGEMSRIPRRNRLTSTPKLPKNVCKKSDIPTITKISSGATKIPVKLTESTKINKNSVSKLPKFVSKKSNLDRFHNNNNTNNNNVVNNNAVTVDLVNFSETKTSKQLMDQINKMVTESDESLSNSNSCSVNKKLDRACKPTGWVRLAHEIDLNNPKARANLLDVMLASSDSSPTSSFDESCDLVPHFDQMNKSLRSKKFLNQTTSAPCTPMTETSV